MRVRYDGGVGPVGAGVGERRGRPWGGAVRVGMRVRYDGGFAQVAAEIGELERAGLQLVSVAEAYSFDAVSQLGEPGRVTEARGGAALQLVSVAEAYSFAAVSPLGYLAAVTERLELTSGILPVYTRTPTLTAMTAAGLDMASGGRFTLRPGPTRP